MGVLPGIIQLLSIIVIALLLVVPAGNYLAAVCLKKKSRLDMLLQPLEKAILYGTGAYSGRNMTWKEYLVSLLIFNLSMWIVAVVALSAMGMSPDLAFHTASSFTANTDQQHYSGERDVSPAGQMLLTALMFLSSATGLASAFAFVRAFIPSEGGPGNYFEDLVRILFRILLPGSILVSIVFVACGVPQTPGGVLEAHGLSGDVQTIPLGPVASLESIKYLGTNGGGYYNANSAHPFENPSPLTNAMQMILTMLIPFSMIYAFGVMIGSRRQGIILIASVLSIFCLAVLMIVAGAASSPYLPDDIIYTSGYLEGKEQRFTAFESVFFVAVNTYVQSGGTPCSISSMMPSGVFGAFVGMLLGCVPGGIGVGLEMLILYVIVSVFVAGLMAGRTPVFLGKKIEPREMKLVVSVIILLPMIILISSAATVAIMPVNELTLNDGTRGFSELVYEFISASANNGSGMGGLTSGTLYFNVISGILILIGRYVPIAIFLSIAGSISTKPTITDPRGSLRTESLTFAVFLSSILIVNCALSFLPLLVLGPLAEVISTGVRLW